MAEANSSTILEKLTDIAIDKASEAWTLARGAEDEVKRLQRNFKALQYELEHAEEKQYVDKRLEHWLYRFKEVCYDMEDVLDDWKTAVQEMQTADRGDETSTTSVLKRKVSSFFSLFSFGSEIVERHGIATRIKDINEKLDQIVNDRDKFELIKREMIKQPKRPESTSFVDVSRLHGRDDVKEDIIRTILLSGIVEEEGSCIPTISIVGMGGIGKTALAQLVYNDHRIQGHFDKTIWVCVSDPFDQSQIARAILEDLDPSSTMSHQSTIPLQALLSNIRASIQEKKFFLVLDDVWADHGEDWEQIRAIFQSPMLGSRILVTTRKGSVAKHIESSHVFPLDELSDDMCWRILSQKAFSGRNKTSYENLADIGRAIAKKCKGLPLAAKTLGGLLQDKLGREEWENVLNSEIWKLDIAQKDIFKHLLLSYFDLPSTIRRCLLYCAIFPKNYRIYKDKLVQFWMAQEFLNSDDNLEIESKGEEYFKCLATHSFFQDFNKDDNGDLISCKMHDMVHDFVWYLTKYEFVRQQMAKDLTLDLSSNNTRHLRLVFGKGSSSPMSYGAEKLHSLVAVSVGFNYPSSKALRNLFSQSKHLRLLEVDSFYLDEEGIAGDIGNLIHLRYLSLINCSGVENLPEAVCELPNLLSLSLRYCSELKKLPVGMGKLIKLRYLLIEFCTRLEELPVGIGELINLRFLSIKDCDMLWKLPTGIGKLINLRYLIIKGCGKLWKLPDGIGKLINLRYLCIDGSPDLTYCPREISNLTSLMRLSKIRMRADCNDPDRFSIGDLENLDLLDGNLCVELIGNGIDWNEAKRAKLHNKIHLKRMDIWICSPNIKKEEVVQALNPPSNMHVTLFDYQTWMARERKYADISALNASLQL